MENKKLKQCSDCDKEISKNAKSCPHCGAMNKKKTSLLSYALLGFLIWMLFAAVFEGQELINGAQQSGGAVASGERQPQAVNGSESLELETFQCSNEHGFVTVTGRVKNLTDKPIKNIQAVSEHFSKAGDFINSDSALIEYNPIMPGQSSPFKTIGTHNPLMSTCSVSFKTLMGGTLAVRRK